MTKNIWLVVVGLMLVTGGLLYFKPNIALGATCQFARPYFGSINCEMVGSPRTVTVPGGSEYVLYNPNTPTHSDYINPKFNGLKTPDFVEPDCGITALYSYIKLQTAEYNSNTWSSINTCNAWSSLSTCRQQFKDLQGRDLPPTKKIRVIATCGYVSGEEDASNQYDYNWLITFNDEVFRYYKDSSGGTPISGTEGCKYNNLYDKYYSSQKIDQPTTTTNWQKLLNALNPINKVFGLGFMPSTSEVNIPTDSYAGQAYLFVQDWVVRPDMNIKNYNGQQVYCNSEGSTSKLYKVESLTTNGACYSIPTSELASVDCCDDTICLLTRGNGYGCDESGTNPTFKCVPSTQTQCNSDFDCGAQQTTCSKDSYGKYFLSSGARCSVGKCVASAKTEVKCCTGSDGGPQICSGYCNYQEGCKQSQVPCPVGKWCVAGSGCPYYAQSCASGLKSCPSGECMGDCKVSCGEVQCSQDSDCDDKNSETVDKCVSDWLGAKSCTNTKTPEQSCFQTCGVTNIGCIADCYVSQWMASALKFVASLVMGLAVSLIVDVGMYGSKKRNKDILQRTVVMLMSFVITVVMFNLYVVL